MVKITKPLLAVVFVAILAAILFILWSFQTPSSPVVDEEFTPSTAANLPKTFSAVVAYTDSGFEPSEFTVEEGDTVRFINNSSGSLWVGGVSSEDNKAYPGTSTCKTSAFNSCRGLLPSEYWDFTFAERGTWLFTNDTDTEAVGVIYVQ